MAFIWGAAQMGDKARLKPKAIPDPEIAAMLARENQVVGRWITTWMVFILHLI